MPKKATKKKSSKKKKATKKRPAKKKNPGGRPSKKNKIDYDLMNRLADLGLTDAEISHALGICERTLNTYKKDKKFLHALKRGKDVADARVVQSLYKRACGYSHPDTKFATYEGEITDEREYIKHYPPDTTACIFWLKNRRPEEWREKHEVEHSGNIDREYHLKGASEKELDGLLRTVVSKIVPGTKKGNGEDTRGESQ